MKHLSRPTILGFGHPSGALEDGARGHSLGILAIKSTLEMPFHTGMVLVLCFFYFAAVQVQDLTHIWP